MMMGHWQFTIYYMVGSLFEFQTLKSPTIERAICFSNGQFVRQWDDDCSSPSSSQASNLCLFETTTDRLTDWLTGVKNRPTYMAKNIGIIWYHHCHWWNGSCSTIKMLLNCVSNIWQLKRITFQENSWKDYFGINSFFTASSASVRTSLFTTVEAAAQEMMETNAARTRRRCDNMIPLQLSLLLHLTSSGDSDRASLKGLEAAGGEG